MKKHNEATPNPNNPQSNTAGGELDDQELEKVSGGVGANSSSPFRKQGKAGGPVVHALDEDAKKPS